VTGRPRLRSSLGVTAMNYIKMAIALIALTASSVSQAPKDMSPGRPNLSDSFTKTGLKAIYGDRRFQGDRESDGTGQGRL
jgi:hypothetical protein